jgi:hypothetical protein
MSTRALAALGLVIAAVGFGLGRYTASPSDAGESESGTARPGESADTRVDESADTLIDQSAGALVDVLRDPDAFSRARRLATLLPALGPEAVPELRAALEDPGIELQGAEVELLVRFWATHEPADASEWAFTRSPPGYRGPAMALAIELWAREDPQAAAQRAGPLGLQGGSTSHMIQVALVSGWLQSGRPGLEDYIRDLGPSFEQQRALVTVARIKVRHGARRGGPGRRSALV